MELSSVGLFMNAPIDQFAGVKNLGKLVGSHSASLQAHFSTQQYLISLIVAERSLDSIDRIRTSVAKNILIPMIHRSKQRLDHQFNVFSIHGVAHFSASIFSQSERAGILTENDLVIIRSTGFYDVNPCMQGDSIRSREKEPDRPTTVSDSGLV